VEEVKTFPEEIRRKVSRFLGNTNRFWMLTAFLVGAVALAKGWRLPNRWSATQAQVGYEFGVVKRGLFGALVSRPLHLEHYARFAVVSYFVLLALMAGLVVYTVRSGISQRLLTLEVIALFFSSYGITYLSHLVGYLDLVVGILVVGLLLIRNPLYRLLIGIPVSLAAIMVHELFLFIFLPVLLLSFLLQGFELPEKSQFRRMLGSALLLAAVTGSFTVWLSLRPSLRPEQVSAAQDQIQARSDFPVRTTFFSVMKLSARDNMYSMGEYYRSRRWWLLQGLSFATFAPTIILLLFIANKVIKSDPNLPARAMMILAIAASLSPLAMHLLGWDVARFNAWVVIAAYLVLLTVCQFSSGAAVSLSPAIRNAMIMALLLNMASGGLLMDDRVVSSFPFLPEKPFTIQSLHPSAWSPPSL
jgi:hypothetical protein